LGRIPDPGDRLEHDGWQLEVLELDKLRVALIRLRRAPDAGKGTEADR
jgi:CBS domain containing-hemolysin-like protein